MFIFYKEPWLCQENHLTRKHHSYLNMDDANIYDTFFIVISYFIIVYFSIVYNYFIVIVFKKYTESDFQTDVVGFIGELTFNMWLHI